MIEFVFAGVVLVLLALLVLSIPLWKKTEFKAEDPQGLNVQAYKERVVDLEQDKASGLLDPSDFQKLEKELKLTLLQDASAKSSFDTADFNSGKTAIIAALCILPLLVGGIYIAKRDPQAFKWMEATVELNQLAKQAIITGDLPSDLGDYNAGEFIRVLQAGLQNGELNQEGWPLLGMALDQVQRPDLSAQAWGKVWNNDPGNPRAMLNYARALVNNEGLTTFSRNLLNQAWEKAPEIYSSMVVLGMGEYQQGNFRAAVSAWETVINYYPNEERLASLLNKSIASAKKELGSVTASPHGQAMPQGHPTVAQQPDVQVDTQAGVASSSDAADISITVSLDLSDQLKNAIDGHHSLFVFLRPLAGGPPLAAVRKSANSLPLEVTIDGSNTMTGAPLVAGQKVMVVARLVKGGGPTASSGDLEGILGPVELANSMYQLTIDRLIP
ncbi:c-type cytochrome biogenesis protein CcmI [Pelagibaculum spongiae]|uniref:C-type cytochrome biogenesis protein CcmI n=1 Tax=Pelagibaculum spongiae TaxID=2080658 RepID=A0A2V1H2X0_9GAMM|nr:c-type cytochrome biogenesis protein CcmI [Pelagibaculum spongiae]PVZ71568.1 c-type cytochrome biogenesis protein CcmI [Pelagibaculum spongiae]